MLDFPRKFCVKMFSEGNEWFKRFPTERVFLVCRFFDQEKVTEPAFRFLAVFLRRSEWKEGGRISVEGERIINQPECHEFTFVLALGNVL